MATDQPQLQRTLGLWACVSIVVGAAVGSGIFMVPATMATQLGSPLLLLLVWLVAGLVSLVGGMINAEVGAALPHTGGQYVYFRHMYGDFFAFLYGWACFIVINTAGIASIAYVFAQYTEYFVPLPRLPPELEHALRFSVPFIGEFFPLANLGVKALTVALLVGATWLNARSVSASGFVAILLSTAKVAALLWLVAAVVFSHHGSVANLLTPSATLDRTAWGLITAFVAATTGALGAYDGWNVLGYVAGEVKEPQKNIPRGLVIGLGLCILLYVLTSAAYFYVLPIDEIKSSPLVAADALRRAVGVGAGGLVALLVMLSTAGATNGNILPCARITFAMAREGRFFPFAGRVHPRFFTPSRDLWLQAGVCCAFVVLGSFDLLLEMFVFMSWIFYAFGAAGIFLVRKNIPASARPYRMWGYPWLPVVFIAFAATYVGITLWNDISAFRTGHAPVIKSALGLGLAALGIPVYWYLRRHSPAPSPDARPV